MAKSKLERHISKISEDSQQIIIELNRLFREKKLGLKVIKTNVRKKEMPALKILQSRPFVRRSEINPSLWNAFSRLEKQGTIGSVTLPSIIKHSERKSYIKPVKYYYLPHNKPKLKLFKKQIRQEIKKSWKSSEE